MRTLRRASAAIVAVTIWLPVASSAPVRAQPATGARSARPLAAARLDRSPARDGTRAPSADGSELAAATPGAIRPAAVVTLTIFSVADAPTPFEPAAQVTAPDGTITGAQVSTDHTTITATFSAPPVPTIVTVTVTNPSSGHTYKAGIDVRLSTGEFHPTAPQRVFDTRFASGTLFGPVGRLAPDQTVTAPIATKLGLEPATVDSVVVNVTAVGPSANGFLTAWPSQHDKPNASTINFARGHDVANLATLPLGPDGGLSVAASTATDVILDVVGWYTIATDVGNDTSPVASAYLALPPERRTDTRFPMSQSVNRSTFPIDGPLHAGDVRTLSLDHTRDEFRAVDAVALNVTVSGPTRAGFLTIWPDGQPRPDASSLNFGTGDAIPNMVIVPISADHKLNVYNSAGDTDVIIDLVGVYETEFFGGLLFASTDPTRIVDTRLGTGLPARPPDTNETATIAIGGTGTTDIPDYALAVVMNAVITDSSTRTGFMKFYASDDAAPDVSNLNVQLGRAAANQAIVPLSLDGTSSIAVFNANGPADLIADVTGFFYLS